MAPTITATMAIAPRMLQFDHPPFFADFLFAKLFAPPLGRMFTYRSPFVYYRNKSKIHMKKCPLCGTQYTDETLSYCLQDGTPLGLAPQAETPTVVLGETETFAPRDQPIRVPITGTDPVTHTPASKEKDGSYTVYAVVLTAIGMLLLFGLVGLGVIIFWSRPDPQLARNSDNVNTVNPVGASPSPSSKPSPIHTVQTTPGTTPRTSPESTTAPPPAPGRYPETTRLKFAHGAVTTSFSGEVNPGDSRSLVLACRSGQSLSASINSGTNCVTVRGGSSMRMTTSGGDNYITVTNTCTTIARFSISITVI
jgi:hypothetical protein